MQCNAQAILIVTQDVKGTSTNVAKRRVKLTCRLEAEHAGNHKDAEQAEEWEDSQNDSVTVFRHEK